MFVFFPDKITQLCEKAGRDFYLVVPPAFQGKVSLERGMYASANLVFAEDHQGFRTLIESFSANAHVLYIPNFDRNKSLLREADLKPQQTIIKFGTATFPVNWSMVRSFLEVLCKTDVESQIRLAEYFFELIDKNNTISFQDNNYGTAAYLEMVPPCQLNELYGYAGDQQIQVSPTGEVAISSDEPFSIFPKPLPLNGKICLQSYPLVSSHGCEPFMQVKNQQRLHRCLVSLISNPVIVTFKNGKIIELAPAENTTDLSGLRVLSSLMEIDQRYATLVEIGIGLNTQFKIRPVNCGLIEVYGHRNYCVHYGFGNASTDYHLDLISPNTKIVIGNKVLNT